MTGEGTESIERYRGQERLSRVFPDDGRCMLQRKREWQFQKGHYTAGNDVRVCLMREGADGARGPIKHWHVYHAMTKARVKFFESSREAAACDDEWPMAKTRENECEALQVRRREQRVSVWYMQGRRRRRRPERGRI